MIRRILMSLVVCLTTAEGAPLPPETAVKIDEVFAEWSGTRTPGCAIGIMRDERLVFARGYGMADLERGIAISPDTVFGIQSTSKQFVAFAVALLERDGKLSVDDDVRKYVPELPDYGETITIRHLLEHTSGLRCIGILTQDQGVRRDEPLSDDYLLRLIARQRKLNHPPGEADSYTNSGYFLLHQIVERVSGKKLGEFAQERIFVPLGMKSTRFRLEHDEIVPARAQGYQRRSDGAWHLAGNAKGNVFTTVKDLALWSANFATPVVGDRKLIDRMTTWGMLDSGHRTDWGWGLSPIRYRGLEGIYFSGGGFDGTSVFVRFPRENFGMSLLCNGSLTFNAEDLGRKVVDVVLAEEIARAEKVATAPAAVVDPSPVDVATEELQRVAGLYFTTDRGPWRREFRLENGVLKVVASPELIVDLIPLGNDRFRVKGAKTEYLFAADRVTRIPPGEPTAILHRVNAEKPAKLEDFAGIFWNDEVEASIRFSVSDGKLRYSIADTEGKGSLEPIFADAFEDGPLVFRFKRDPAGRVVGLSKHWDRVWDLEYVKLPPGLRAGSRREE
jgi:CubicO group peptidase (beta-lactamase class C family)